MLAVYLPIVAGDVGKTLQIFNYDGDTSRELELTLLLPNQQRRVLNTSGGRNWARNDFLISSGFKGQLTLLARIPVTARQFSNAFRLRFVMNGKPFFVPLVPFKTPSKTKIIEPITVSVIDPGGKAIAGASYKITSDKDGARFASPVLPAGYVPVKAVINSGEAKIISSTSVKVGFKGANLKFIAQKFEGGLAVETVARVGNELIPLPSIGVTVGGQSQADTGNPQGELDEGLEVRIPVTAGSHLVAATFLKDTVKPEGVLDRAGNQAFFEGVGSVSVAGPYAATGSGDTASRRRIFLCRLTAVCLKLKPRGSPRCLRIQRSAAVTSLEARARCSVARSRAPSR